jgi:hypothetical protein
LSETLAESELGWATVAPRSHELPERGPCVPVNCWKVAPVLPPHAGTRALRSRELLESCSRVPPTCRNAGPAFPRTAGTRHPRSHQMPERGPRVPANCRNAGPGPSPPHQLLASLSQALRASVVVSKAVTKDMPAFYAAVGRAMSERLPALRPAPGGLTAEVIAGSGSCTLRNKCAGC